ncbi:hypothetical protein [Bacillus sp. FJAT-26390]|uniref:hypothetical protein n=1 Tax=Bacillus sp. FJAT-26390 TaxID=1743142 RepID=UPI000807D9E7|nr:hypothetical protein [Bacillus sp. FJAT-26390]OBZ13568.1 hypothetical protein A7975_12145 [Bacillus sp. FJAT-26390]
MRRYWLSIVIAVIAVSGIGTYYTYGKQNHLPEYKLETIQGDPKEAAAVSLTGAYYGNMSSEFLKVNAAGSEYGGLNMKNIRLGITDANSWFYNLPGIKQLINDHKSFMRGKQNSGFYRDKEWVIYADTVLENTGLKSRFSALQLSVLNEATEKISEFELSFERERELRYLNIVDVQRVDEEVHILVGTFYTDNPQSEYEVFVMDITSGKLLRNEKLESWGSTKSDQKEEQIQVSAITTNRFLTPADNVYFIFKKVKVNDRMDEAARYAEKLSEKFYSYSYRTGLMIELPEMVREQAANTERVHSGQNEYLYVAEYDTDHVAISRYSAENQKYEHAYVSVSAEQLGVNEIKKVQFGFNRLYILFNQAGIPGTAVVDITNGKLLFIGSAAFVGDKEQAKDQLKKLHLLNFEINESIIK